jgi:hypothetical protein
MEHNIFGTISGLTQVVAYTGRVWVSNSTITKTKTAGQARFPGRYDSLARRTRHTQTVVETKLVRRGKTITVAALCVVCGGVVFRFQRLFLNIGQ